MTEELVLDCFFEISSRLDKIIAKSPNIPPNIKFKSSLSVLANTDKILVMTAENGIIIATIHASICFIELVRIIQHSAEIISVIKITSSICIGFNENMIFSIGSCVREADVIVTELRTSANIKDIKKLVVAWVTRYNVTFNFLANTLVPAILKPYSKPEIAHRISPIPHDESESDIPFNINVLARQIKQAATVVSFGFFLTKIYINTGTEIHDKFSKKAYLAGVVYNRPIFWLILANARKIPVGTPIFI